MSTIITRPRKYRLKIDETLDQYIPAQQGDVRTRIIHFYLMKEEAQFMLNEVSSVECFGIKPDGVKIFNTCVIEDIEKGVVSVDLNKDVLSTVGDIQMQLTLRGFGGEVLSTTVFYVRVNKSLKNEYLESLESCDVLDALIKETEITLDKLKETFSSNEAARQHTFDTNEANRINEFNYNQTNRHNEFTNLINDYSNRIDQMTIAKQQDLEVINARTSTSKSKTFETLNHRLEDGEADILNLKTSSSNHENRISTVETRSSSNKAEIDTLTALVEDIIDGDVGIGNADTLDGHDSTYFATAQNFSDVINGAVKVGNAETLDGKDSTYFAPSSHTHSWVQISDKPTSFNPSTHQHGWADITGKPATFTPSTHTHSEYSKNGHGHSWSDISGKPSSYPPSGHTHNIWEITDYHHQHWAWRSPNNDEGRNGDLWFQLG